MIFIPIFTTFSLQFYICNLLECSEIEKQNPQTAASNELWFVVQRDNEWHAVYAGRTADVYVNLAKIPGWIKKQVVSRINERNEM